MIKIRILSEATKQKTINVTPAGLRLANQPPPEERHEYLLTPQQRKQIVSNRDKLVEITINAMQTKQINVAELVRIEAFFNKYHDEFMIEGDEGEYGDTTEMLHFFWSLRDFKEVKPIGKKIVLLQKALTALQRTFSLIPLRCDDDESDDCLGFSDLAITPKQRKEDYEEMMGMQNLMGVDFVTGEEIPPKKPATVKTLKGKR